MQRYQPLMMASQLVLLLIIAVLLFCIFDRQRKTELHAAWEYNVVSTDDLVLDDALQILGSDGWELVSARRAGLVSGNGEQGFECIYKRRTESASASKEYRDAMISYLTLQKKRDAELSIHERRIDELQRTQADHLASNPQLAMELGNKINQERAAALRIIQRYAVQLDNALDGIAKARPPLN